MRTEIRVQPGARSASVGGTHDGALIVRVSQAAENGRATVAALRAVARALGVPARDVRLVAGAATRRKIVDVGAGDDSARVLHRLDELRRAGRRARAGQRRTTRSK